MYGIIINHGIYYLVQGILLKAYIKFLYSVSVFGVHKQHFYCYYLPYLSCLLFWMAAYIFNLIFQTRIYFWNFATYSIHIYFIINSHPSSYYLALICIIWLNYLFMYLKSQHLIFQNKKECSEKIINHCQKNQPV